MNRYVKIYIVGYSTDYNNYLLEGIDAKKINTGYMLLRESTILQRKIIKLKEMNLLLNNIFITDDKKEANYHLKNMTKEFNKNVTNGNRGVL